MEFGIFIQTSVFKHNREGNPNYEHQKIMQDVELAVAADKAGFKYVLGNEHHFLDEYSHMSANDVVLAYIAALTTRIHIAAAIFNPLPQVIHPAKLAETVAMLDHLSNNRFEFGTGRGAGSHEILGFLPDMKDLTGTREIWEDVIGEFRKMWMNETYPGYDGKFWSLPPRKVLPKPYGKSHPAIWYAAGNTSSYEMAARKGLGIMGFSVGSLDDLGKVITAYKGNIAKAEPVGDYVNDNVLVTVTAHVSNDEGSAVRQACSPEEAYHISNVFRYHDTFPHPPEIPTWPAVMPTLTPDAVDYVRGTGTVIGDPDHAVEQFKRWESAGADQVVIPVGNQSMEDTLEMIRLMGEHVIPKLDRDPVHRTTRMRMGA